MEGWGQGETCCLYSLSKRGRLHWTAQKRGQKLRFPPTATGKQTRERDGEMLISKEL